MSGPRPGSSRGFYTKEAITSLARQVTAGDQAAIAEVNHIINEIDRFDISCDDPAPAGSSSPPTHMRGEGSPIARHDSTGNAISADSPFHAVTQDSDSDDEDPKFWADKCTVLHVEDVSERRRQGSSVAGPSTRRVQNMPAPLATESPNDKLNSFSTKPKGSSCSEFSTTSSGSYNSFHAHNECGDHRTGEHIPCRNGCNFLKPLTSEQLERPGSSSERLTLEDCSESTYRQPNTNSITHSYQRQVEFLTQRHKDDNGNDYVGWGPHPSSGYNTMQSHFEDLLGNYHQATQTLFEPTPPTPQPQLQQTYQNPLTNGQERRLTREEKGKMRATDTSEYDAYLSHQAGLILDTLSDDEYSDDEDPDDEEFVHVLVKAKVTPNIGGCRPGHTPSGQMACKYCRDLASGDPPIASAAMEHTIDTQQTPESDYESDSHSSDGQEDIVANGTFQAHRVQTAHSALEEVREFEVLESCHSSSRSQERRWKQQSVRSGAPPKYTEKSQSTLPSASGPRAGVSKPSLSLDVTIPTQQRSESPYSEWAGSTYVPNSATPGSSKFPFSQRASSFEKRTPSAQGSGIPPLTDNEISLFRDLVLGDGKKPTQESTQASPRRVNDSPSSGLNMNSITNIDPESLSDEQRYLYEQVNASAQELRRVVSLFNEVAVSSSPSLQKMDQGTMHMPAYRYLEMMDRGVETEENGMEEEYFNVVGTWTDGRFVRDWN